jgi:hypothetical protein
MECVDEFADEFCEKENSVVPCKVKGLSIRHAMRESPQDAHCKGHSF